jgi:lysozyme
MRARLLLTALWTLVGCTRSLEESHARRRVVEARLRAAPSDTSVAAPSVLCEDLSRGPGAQALPPYPGGRARGVDVSTAAPWKLLAGQGVRFAFIAAAHSTEPVPAFRANWHMARRCGLLRGAYHFVAPDRDGAAQADLLLRQLDGDLGELAPVIDVEQHPRCRDVCCELDPSAWQATVAAWLRRVEQRSGRRPLVYTARAFWQRCLGDTTRFADHPLWLAAPSDVDPRAPAAFGGWRRWQFLQHARQLRMGGSVIDQNLYAGTEAELSRSDR